MGKDGATRGCRPRKFAFLALLTLSVVAGCPVEEEETTQELKSSAPFELELPLPESSWSRPPSPVPAPQLTLAAEPRVMVGVSFQASELGADTGYIPPDTMGAVGPTQIVEMINGSFAVFDKSGLSLSRRSLDSFWFDVVGLTVENGDTFDPRIVFDPVSGRFFASSVDRDPGLEAGGEATGNNIYLARSDSSDATGDWDGVRFAADTEGIAEFHDFDTLALDADGVYICTLDLTANSGLDAGQSCYSIPKADLLLDPPSLENMTPFEGSPPNLPAVFGSVQPALDFGPSDGRTALLGVTFGGFGELLRGNILGAASAGATLGSVETIVGDPGYFAWINVRQPRPSVGRRFGLEQNGNFIRGNVVQQGDSLWAVHSVRGSGSNLAVRWYEIHEPTNTMLQTGLIENLLEDYVYPSIAVNEFGQVVIGYTCTGGGLAASACVSAGETLEGVTEFDPPLLLRLGAGYYYQDYGTGRNRWGDYSATVVDPATPCTFWTFQEFVAAAAEGEVGPPPLSGGGLWGTEITQLTFTSCGATVRVEKTVDADLDGVFDDDPSGWTFDVTNGVAHQATTDATGELTFRMPPGISSVTELGGPPGDTGLWLVNASCVDDATGLPLSAGAEDQPFGPTLPGVTTDGLDLAPASSITCSFQNQRMAGSLTGGGQIRTNPRRKVSFGGDVGLASDGMLDGEFQVKFHNVSHATLSGGQFVGTLVDGVVFGSDESKEAACPPRALFNEVHFRVSGELDEVPCQLSVDATDHGESSKGGADVDAIRLRLDCAGSLLDYDTALDFPEEETAGMHHLDSGNLQIHAPD